MSIFHRLSLVRCAHWVKGGNCLLSIFGTPDSYGAPTSILDIQPAYISTDYSRLGWYPHYRLSKQKPLGAIGTSVTATKFGIKTNHGEQA